MELYAIGDSFVYGYRVAASARWTTLLAHQSGWSVHNLGVNGDTLPGMLTRLHTELPALLEKNRSRPAETCVLLMGGTNDVFCDCPGELLHPAAAAILQQIAALGLLPIACAAPLPTGEALAGWELFADPVACIPVLRDYGDWLARYCAAFGFPMLDLRDLYRAPDGSLLPGRCLDGIHPNAEGHRIIADRLCALLRQLES